MRRTTARRTTVKRKKALKITLIVVLALFVAFSIVSYGFVKSNFDNIFSRTVLGEYNTYLRWADAEGLYVREPLSFLSGENRLQGYLYGAGNSKGLVVVSHGLGGGAENYTAQILYFVDHGYQVFAYDNTGCYQSEGEDCVGLSQSVLDLDAALTFIEGEPRFEGLPVFLFGHSWGGYAVAAIFHFPHNITASASVAGFNKPMQVILEWAEDMLGSGLTFVETPYIWLYHNLTFRKNANLNAVDAINATDTPVLIIHGDQDTTVRYTGAGIINYRDEITNPNAQFKICDQAYQNTHNQLFFSRDAIDYMLEVDAAYEALDAQYGGEIPEAVTADFFAGVDKWRMSELNEDLMSDILAFYEAAAG